MAFFYSTGTTLNALSSMATGSPFNMRPSGLFMAPALAWLRNVTFVDVADVCFRAREIFFCFAKAAHAHAHAADDASAATAAQIGLAVLSAAPTEAKRATGKQSALRLDNAAWDAVAVAVMEAAAEQQLEQNSRLRSVLLGTAGSVIVEASPYDPRWGIGLGMALAAATPRAGWGTNLHGRLLMRRRLLLEVDGPPHGPVGVAGHSSTEIGIG